MHYDSGKEAWEPAGTILDESANSKGLLSRHGGAEAVGHPLRRTSLPPSASGTAKSTGKAKYGPQRFSELVTDMAFSSKEWFAATGRGLLVSSDQGATWRPKPVGQLASLPVQSVWVSSNGRRLKVVSLRGLVFSDDGGYSWTWHDLPLQSGGAVTLASDPSDENTLVATSRSGLYISRDAGTSWQQAASGLPSIPVQAFAATGGLFIASMRAGGLYVSSDSGHTWDRVRGTLADSVFVAVAPTNEPGVIFAASETEGLYKVEWPSATAIRADPLGKSRKGPLLRLASTEN